MKQRKRKRPTATLRERFISTHKEHWAIMGTVWSAALLVAAIFGSGWAAPKYIITKPEVLALHDAQEQEIAANKGGLGYLMQAQVANLYGERAVILERIRRGRELRGDRERLKQLEKEIEALEKARGKK